MKLGEVLLPKTRHVANRIAFNRDNEYIYLFISHHKNELGYVPDFYFNRYIHLRRYHHNSIEAYVPSEEFIKLVAIDINAIKPHPFLYETNRYTAINLEGKSLCDYFHMIDEIPSFPIDGDPSYINALINMEQVLEKCFFTLSEDRFNTIITSSIIYYATL